MLKDPCLRERRNDTLETERKLGSAEHRSEKRVSRFRLKRWPVTHGFHFNAAGSMNNRCLLIVLVC